MLSKRKFQRLPYHNYNQLGFYFITINTKNRISYFGSIENGQMHLSDIGQIINSQWLWLAQQYPFVTLDEYIIMPDHFHGLICINEFANSTDLHPRRNHALLSKAICAFKTTSSKIIHLHGLSAFTWHRSFHDRQISGDRALQNVRHYIRQNPRAWDLRRSDGQP